MRREFFTPVGARVARRDASVSIRLFAAAAAAALGCVVAIGAALPASATSANPVPSGSGQQSAAPCHVISSRVVGGVAKFVVGPNSCQGSTGSLSFSTYSLKDGKVLPFASQVVYDHSAGNGKAYGAGTYELTARLPECSWQSDLYLGESQPSAPHVHATEGLNVGWDFREGNRCGAVSPQAPIATEAATSTATARPTATAAPTSATTVAPTPAPSASTTYVSDVLGQLPPAAAPSATYLSEVLAAEPNLAATGSAVAPLFGGALVLLVAGATLVGVRRRSGRLS